MALVETLLLAVDHAASAFEFLAFLFARTLLATRLSVLILDHILDVLPMLFVVSLFVFGEFAYATGNLFFAFSLVMLTKQVVRCLGTDGNTTRSVDPIVACSHCMLAS